MKGFKRTTIKELHRMLRDPDVKAGMREVYSNEELREAASNVHPFRKFVDGYYWFLVGIGTFVVTTGIVGLCFYFFKSVLEK